MSKERMSKTPKFRQITETIKNCSQLKHLNFINF